jgi:hypothetical protein
MDISTLEENLVFIVKNYRSYYRSSLLGIGFIPIVLRIIFFNKERYWIWSNAFSVSNEIIISFFSLLTQ